MVRYAALIHPTIFLTLTLQKVSYNIFLSSKLHYQKNDQNDIIMRILLVEDEEDLGLAIKQVLVSKKYIVDWIKEMDTLMLWLTKSRNQRPLISTPNSELRTPNSDYPLGAVSKRK